MSTYPGSAIAPIANSGFQSVPSVRVITHPMAERERHKCHTPPPPRHEAGNRDGILRSLIRTKLFGEQLPGLTTVFEHLELVRWNHLSPLLSLGNAQIAHGPEVCCPSLDSRTPLCFSSVLFLESGQKRRAARSFLETPAVS